MKNLSSDIINLVDWTLKNLQTTPEESFNEWFFWHHQTSEWAAVNYWLDDPPHYNVIVNFVRANLTDVTGSAGLNESGIVTIEINVHGQNKFNITNLRPNLINVYAHELQHLTQNGMPFERINAIKYDDTEIFSNNAFKYFTCGSEVEAFASGCLYESKLTGKSYDRIVNSYLQNYVFENYLSKKEKDVIIKKWKNAIELVF